MKNYAPKFEKLVLDTQERRLIEPFFTNLDDSVYGITFLPPQMAGALCSRTSRAKDDLRLALLNEYLQPFLKEDNEYATSLRALIDFLHAHPVEKIFANPKAQEFYIKWLAQFGDDSIAQMAGAHLAFSSLSQIAIKHIEDMRIGIAPIEKSTRYVDYSTKVDGSYRYYTDPDLADFDLLEEYHRAMDNLFDTYTTLMAEYKAFLKAKYPAEEERVLNTKAFDVLRLLLPVSTLSQVAFFANGQSFEYMVNRSLDHKLGEIRWAAKRSLEELSKFIPAFLHRAETPPAATYRQYLTGRTDRVREVLKNMDWKQEAPKNGEAVRLLECDADAEKKIIASLVFKETGESFDVVLGKVHQLSLQQKEEILKAALQGRTQKYYKVPRAFENAYLRFEITMNIGAWRDLHRHRMHTQDRQLFTVENGFDVPVELKEAGLDTRFTSAILRVEEVYRKVARHSPDIAQYCTTMAHKVRFTQYQNFRAFFWEAELRTISSGHPDYRKIEHEKIKLVQRMYPLLCKYLLADMGEYDFARRGDTVAIQRKEDELRRHFAAPTK